MHLMILHQVRSINDKVGRLGSWRNEVPAVNGAKIRAIWDDESTEGAKRQEPGLIGPGKR